MTDTTALADELLGVLLGADPVGATVTGVPGYDERLPDHSEAAEFATRDAALDIARRAAALTPDTADDRVTAAVIKERAESCAAEIEARTVEHSIAESIFAPAAAMLTILPMVPATTDDQGEAYLTRLAGLPQFLDGLAERHRAGVASGRLPVANLVASTIGQFDRYLADPAADPLLRPQGGAEFDRRRRALLADVVHPAYARYRTVLADELAPHGRPEDRPGLCHLPDGDAAYAALAKVHTTTDRTPDELHETGLALIDALDREYAELGGRVFGIARPADVFARLREDPELRWGSGDELLDTARTTIERAERAAPDWFGIVPEQHCTVEAVPAAEAPGAVAAYYLPPALDGSRPGIYFANTHRAGERFRYILEATAFHEAVPGHHFQLCLAQGLDRLPLLRRLVTVTAYAEGWGLYTERLAEEMGLYSDDIARFGMLTLDSMRAGRLVVDTGLHANGWTRQQAIDFLQARTPMSPVEIVAEVDRYIAVPGQALAYMVGRLEIQRLRADAEAALGSRFDIRAFHDLVLGGGSLPLAVLAGVVDRWVAAHP